MTDSYLEGPVPELAEWTDTMTAKLGNLTIGSSIMKYLGCSDAEIAERYQSILDLRTATTPSDGSSDEVTKAVIEHAKNGAYI